MFVGFQVSVRTLPRCDSLPIVKCDACTPEANVRKRSIVLEQPLLGESLLDPPGPSSSRAHGNFNIYLHLESKSWANLFNLWGFQVVQHPPTFWGKNKIVLYQACILQKPNIFCI